MAQEEELEQIPIQNLALQEVLDMDKVEAEVAVATDRFYGEKL